MATILVIEPYYGGSHKQFIDEWETHSEHQFYKLTLPARKWKWRLHHAGLSLAKKFLESELKNFQFDLIFSSSMLNLNLFRSITAPYLQKSKFIYYFHENQFNYPLQKEEFNDKTYGFIQLSSCEIADEIWFNSKFNMDSFFREANKFLKTMPDDNSAINIEELMNKSKIHYPGVSKSQINNDAKQLNNNKITILWNARWEFDKQPEFFLDQMQELEKHSSFNLILLGDNKNCNKNLVNKVNNLKSVQFFGFCDNKADYYNWLHSSDIVISTALHEFYGIGILEAINYGCIPFVPKRLVYPELFNSLEFSSCFYSDQNFLTQLIELITLSESKKHKTLLNLKNLIENHDLNQCVKTRDIAIHKYLNTN